MENLPIDINYNKLADWLINRRHCSQQWQTVTAVIRQKIIKAVENMPEDGDFARFKDPAEVTYFQVKELIEKAKETDSGKKNFFGQYSSQIMKDWAEICRLYEKDGVFLADTSQMIARNVNYEIPAIKKQITRCQQIQKECERKEADFTNSAADFRKKYSASCRQIGIEGTKIKTELASLVQNLPDEFNRIATATQELQTAVTYYDEFVAFLMNNDQLQSASLPVLKFVMSRGNVRVYEWRTGQPPQVVEEESIKIDISDELDPTTQAEDIDWGADDNGTIDFGADIDFCDITVESGGQEEDDVIECTDTSDVTPEVREASLEEGVARGDDALSILDNPSTRNLFIDNLMELESFLLQRFAELTSSHADTGPGSQLQCAPATVQLEAEHVETMMSKVQALLKQLTSVQMHHLMLIRSSPRYVDRLCESLRQILLRADKLVLASKEMASKKRAALEEESMLEPHLEALRRQTKTMQQQMEEEISQKYKGRKVNIMGEINMI